jgi:hypothetical protein
MKRNGKEWTESCVQPVQTNSLTNIKWREAFSNLSQNIPAQFKYNT